MGRFEGQTVLVTGASRGLGAALALGFAREGAFVALGCRGQGAKAEEVLAAVRGVGGDGCVLAFDVRERAAVDAAVESLCATRGALDVLVNNAGVACDGPFALMSASDFEDVVNTNLLGTFHVSQAVLPTMMAARRGSIVNVASIAGQHGSAGQANYAASKGGVLALTRTLALELAPRGIRVNAVVPGFLDVGLAARLDHRAAARARERIPLGRFGRGEEVARVVCFVASDEASYLTGQALVVDGGLTA